MKRFAVLLLSAVALGGCRPDDDVVVCPEAITCESFAGTIADLRAAAPPAQTFDVDLGQAQTLQTRAGTTLTFPANALLLPDSTLATGHATVRVRELRSVGEILLAGMHTNFHSGNDDFPVAAAAEINVQAWQGTVRLKWKHTYQPTTPVPTLAILFATLVSRTDTMEQWAAYPQPDTTLRNEWFYVGYVTANPLVVGGVVTGQSVYSAPLPGDTTGWSGFGYLLPDSARVGVRWPAAEVLVTTAGATKTLVYLQPVGSRALYRARRSPTAPDRWVGRLLNGTDALAIVIQERNGQLFYGTKRYVHSPNMLLLPDLEAVCPAELIRRIRLL